MFGSVTLVKAFHLLPPSISHASYNDFGTFFKAAKKMIENKDEKVYLVANMIAMAAGLVLIGESISVGCYVINLLIALAAFLLKTKSILDDEEAGIAGNIYVGGKLQYSCLLYCHPLMQLIM